MPNDPHFDLPRIDLRRPDARQEPRQDARPDVRRDVRRAEPRIDTLLPGVDADPVERSGYRYPSRGSADAGTKRLAVIACGLGVALVAFVGIWSAGSHHAGPVPVIEAEQGPIRVKPANPGGMQLAGADDPFLSGAGTDEKDKLAPPPEAPDPAKLRQAAIQLAATTTAANVVLTQPPVETTPPPHAAPARHAAEHRVAEQKAPDHSTPAHPASHAVPEHPAAEHVVREPAAPVPQHAGSSVQLAAVGSEAAARQEWDRLTHRMPDLLGNRRPELSRTEHDGHTLWRLRTGGFSDTAQAAVFCAQVKAKGGGCTVADF